MNSLQLQELGIDDQWEIPLNQVFVKYEIDTPKRQAAFIGQCSVESNNFKTLEEELNYSAEGLMRTWPSRFPDIDTAEKYAHNPEKLANKVYAGRLGNTEEGDGWKYHGRGLIQLTGRDNYRNCGQALGIDLISNPELLAEPSGAALSAGWFFNKHGLNQLADIGDFVLMSKRINGGDLGLSQRIAKINHAITVLG